MIVTILGSGTCVPSLKRSSCAMMVAVGGRTLLFDLGAGTIRRLLETDTRVFDVSNVFFSHFHPDHTGELASFLFSNKYPDGSLRDETLTLTGGPGFAGFIAALNRLYGKWLDLGSHLLQIVELSDIPKNISFFDGFTITTSPVPHNPESLAYRIDSGDGGSVVYTGDTDFSENLIALAGGTDLLVCECALPDGQKVSGHLIPSEAGKLAARARVKCLVLTHLYPETASVDMVGQCRKHYDGSIYLAWDLMRFDLSDSRRPPAPM